MKHTKRILSWLLTLVMLLSMVNASCLTAWAQATETDAPTTDTDTPSTKTDAPATPGSLETASMTTVTLLSSPDDNHLPTRKDGVEQVKEDKVITGMAYLLPELQGGQIFEDADGDKLPYTNIYWQRSTDGGQSWSAQLPFNEALFGMTTIQVTENAEGSYYYRFYMSDGKGISTDYWELRLQVADTLPWNVTFHVGKDYTGSYPRIVVYPCLGTDDNGYDLPDYDHPETMLYSNFTGELPEGTVAYDPDAGLLDSTTKYQNFYATIDNGKYSYRAFACNSATGEYDIPLGGMCLTIPTDSNVDGNKGGGTELYLQCVSYYTTSKKADNTYFAADDYHVKLDCPIMGCTATMGQVYTKGNYAYYPTVLYAGGNACLYNYYMYPDTPGYMFSQFINSTYQPSYSAATKTGTIAQALALTVTVPQAADYGLYFQWNNFNTTEVGPEGDAPNWADRWTSNPDGTKTAVYMVSKSNANYTWRLSREGYVTRSGWLSNISDAAAVSYDLTDAYTDVLTHDFSHLGTQVCKRDEADLMVNLSPSGYSVLTKETRVRAYRHWEIINSDAGNIMIEPDFHWSVLTGDAAIKPVDGGNTTGNWADVTPGTQDSVIAVRYDAMEVNPGGYGSHGGLFPATNPERVGVMVVAGSQTPHGTADADVDFNMAAGGTTTRSMDWDYNYDTWFYDAADDSPALDFAVTATGAVSVQYAFVTTTAAMVSTLSGWSAVSADGEGHYTVPLKAMNSLGNGMGGTVIIKMTDDTGVSYRLVRVAKVSITAVNASHPGEDFMPGDKITLTFDGLYRAVNKISGIFNPTNFYLRYTAGDQEESGKTGQYQQMDTSVVTLTIPADLTFPAGKDTVSFSFTNGYVFGSMYSASNPFAFLYTMTDTGVGTNFNAVTVNFYISHMADKVITVHKKVTYDVALRVVDATGAALDGCTVEYLRDESGAALAAEGGLYKSLGYGSYSYRVTKTGHVGATDAFTLSSASAAQVKDGVLTLTVTLPAAPAGAWDGVTKAQPAADAEGVYQIGTGAELAWFSDAVNGGQLTIDGKLTADIELASCLWTPIGNATQKFAGSLDGDGHVVKNLYCAGAANQGLFGYLNTGADIKNLGVTGSVTATGNYAGGIAAYMANGSYISGCCNSAAVIASKWAGGIVGYAQSYQAAITDCYNTGAVTATGTAGFAGGIAACGNLQSFGPTITNCYSTGTVTGAKAIGGVTACTMAAYTVNSYYLDGCFDDAVTSAGIRGIAVTAEELQDATFPAKVSSGFKRGCTSPVLTWQTASHAVSADLRTLPDGHYHYCTVCGALLDKSSDHRFDSKSGLCACGAWRNVKNENQLVLAESIATVPAALQATYTDVSALESKLLSLLKSKAGTQTQSMVVDVRLLVDRGSGWVEAAASDFPADGKLTVLLAYPEGISADNYGQYSFYAVHMFTTADFGKTVGDVEYPNMTPTADGLQVTLTGASPVAIGWQRVSPYTPAATAVGANTGDTSHVTLWMGTAVGCLLAAAVLIGRKKRRA